MEYGGFVIVDDIQPAPDRGCYNCKHKGNCERYDSLNDGARRSRLPWECWEAETTGEDVN